MKKRYRRFNEVTKYQLKKMDELYEYILKEHKVDILIRRRNNLLPQYRSLFYTVLQRKYKISDYHLAQFYSRKGSTMTHGSVINSICQFKEYCKQYPELMDIFLKLHPSAKDKEYKEKYGKKIFKILEGITPEQEEELIELITLRKKSWEWKTKNETKIYTGN